MTFRINSHTHTHTFPIASKHLLTHTLRPGPLCSFPNTNTVVAVSCMAISINPQMNLLLHGMRHTAYSSPILITCIMHSVRSPIERFVQCSRNQMPLLRIMNWLQPMAIRQIFLVLLFFNKIFFRSFNCYSEFLKLHSLL